MLENLGFFQEIKSAFYDELVNASHGQKTNLLYAKNPISEQSLAESGTPFQVIVVGGTNFISATVVRKNGRLEILKTTKDVTPILDSKETLVNLIIKHLEPETRVLALNFAFPMNVVTRGNILDGELINGTKEHGLSDLVGKTIGLEIEKEIFLKLNQTVSVAVCNDTVSLGLAGLDNLESHGHKNEVVAVGIVGTGYNFGFFDSSKSFINLESGNLSNFKASSTLSEVDKNSSNPTRNLFEKEVAGAYLWQHFNLLSAQNGLNKTVSDSVKLSDLALSDKSQPGNIARELFVKAAGMVAAQIAALADFMIESDPNQKLNLFIEGSVFWKGFEFEKNVKLALKELTDKEIEIREIQDSAILGTARLVG